jgi:hypothetical protein
MVRGGSNGGADHRDCCCQARRREPVKLFV